MLILIFSLFLYLISNHNFPPKNFLFFILFFVQKVYYIFIFSLPVIVIYMAGSLFNFLFFLFFYFSYIFLLIFYYFYNVYIKTLSTIFTWRINFLERGGFNTLEYYILNFRLGVFNIFYFFKFFLYLGGLFLCTIFLVFILIINFFYTFITSLFTFLYLYFFKRDISFFINFNFEKIYYSFNTRFKG